MSRSLRPAILGTALVAMMALAACGGGRLGGVRGGGEDNSIVVWTGDTIPVRVKKDAGDHRHSPPTRHRGRARRGREDQFNQLLTSAAAAGSSPT